MVPFAGLLLAVVAFSVMAAAVHAGQPEMGQPGHQKLSAVPFTDVTVSDEFWAPRIEINRTKSLPHNFHWCEKTGRFGNFAKAGGLMKGEFEGIYFNDSDVYKVLEGASYSLASHPDPKLDAMVDDAIAKIASAQDDDGYLMTYYTLAEPNNRWTNLHKMHELYCAGHMFESAVAHYQATGKRTFLDVAIRVADNVDSIFGPDKRHDVPGHEEIELALVKLYRITGDERYFKLAQFFIDERGNSTHREIYDSYCQDHEPVREQSEPTGHAVRAMYLYSGMADVAAISGDRGLIDALNHLWDNTVNRKMYITGAVGSTRHGEAFGKDYELPNDTAYCETCASIGMVLWNHRMNLLHADAKYVDVLERVMYNGFLAGIGISGKQFFYVNPLSSDGGHHRQPFFNCACCPSNVVRFLPSMPAYIYAHDGDGIYVNLYIAGVGTIPCGSGTVKLAQQTRYPWDGGVKITVEPEKASAFAINVRIPGWCEGAGIEVNGKSMEVAVEKGYATIKREWKRGDVIDLNMPMPIRRVYAHPDVKADTGRVALQRGPIVYCLEAVDNGGDVLHLALPKDAKLTAEHRNDLFHGTTVIKGKALAVSADDKDGTPTDFVAIPYHLWDNREPGQMVVWIPEDPSLAGPSDASAG